MKVKYNSAETAWLCDLADNCISAGQLTKLYRQHKGDPDKEFTLLRHIARNPHISEDLRRELLDHPCREVRDAAVEGLAAISG